MNLKNLEYIEKNNPVIKEEIDFAEKRINGELPKVYKEFLRYANGMVMNLCVLYDTQSIVESYECVIASVILVVAHQITIIGLGTWLIAPFKTDIHTISLIMGISIL